VTVAETLALIRELRFASPPYRKRIDVIFQNPDTDSKLGSYVAGFNPADAVVICSFQEEFTQLRASKHSGSSSSSVLFCDRQRDSARLESETGHFVLGIRWYAQSAHNY